MTLQEIQALKAANLYNDYLTTTDALVPQQPISAAQNTSVLTATGDGNNRISTMMAYSTGGLNQKYTILFDNSASSESW